MGQVLRISTRYGLLSSTIWKVGGAFIPDKNDPFIKLMSQTFPDDQVNVLPAGDENKGALPCPWGGGE